MILVCPSLLCLMEPQRLGFQNLFHLTLSSNGKMAVMTLLFLLVFIFPGDWPHSLVGPLVPLYVGKDCRAHSASASLRREPLLTILLSGHLKNLLCDSHCARLEVHQDKTSLDPQRELERNITPSACSLFMFYLLSTFFLKCSMSAR